MDVSFRDLEVFPESWTKRHGFSLYESMPRPCSALFLVCTDIRAFFHPSEGEVVSAGKGDVVWIPMGARYRAEVEGGNEHCIDTYTLNFRLYDGGGEDLLLSDRIEVLRKKGEGQLAYRAATLCETVHQTDGAGPNVLRIKAEFYEFLDTVCGDADDRSDAYYPIRAGAEALRNEWNRNEKIETYAAMCGISNAYFYRCFREWSGQSPVEYRNRIRLSNAQTMLRHTDMKVGEISETVGFEDPFYFCRLFSSAFGLSPKEYRKRLRERSVQ